MPKTAPLKFLFNAFLAHHCYDKRGASGVIIIDLEWNCGSDYSGFDEILQIGAVRIKALGGSILGTFNVHVRPQVNTTLHPAAAILPELWHSFADGVCFPVAFLKFREWAQHEKDYAAWGEDDFHVLQQNVTYWNLPPLSIRAAFNLQRGFGQRLGITAQIALCKAVSYCKIPVSFTFHDALNDTMYAALLTQWITLHDLVVPPRAAGFRSCWRWSATPFLPPAKKRSKYLSSIQAVLNFPRMRRQSCPVCGRKLWVQSWFQWQNSETYYAPICCSTHGGFLCRLTMTQYNGLYRGCSAMVCADRRELLRFHAACAGNLLVCQNYKKFCAQIEERLQ